MDVPDDLQVIRIRSKKHEIMIAPHYTAGKEFQLVVVQSSSVAD